MEPAVGRGLQKLIETGGKGLRAEGLGPSEEPKKKKTRTVWPTGAPIRVVKVGRAEHKWQIVT